MALQGTDLFIVQRGQQSYKMQATEIIGLIPDPPVVGNGQITIRQPGNPDYNFTVNQTGNTVIELRNDNTNTDTLYYAGDGLNLSGTTFNVGAGTGIQVTTSAVGIAPGGVTTTELANNSVTYNKINAGSGGANKFLKVNTTNTGLEWGEVTFPDGFDFPSGTTMLFYQASAPVGFTRVTNQHNKALRVVGSSVGGTTGGNTPFTDAFKVHSSSVSGVVGATTLTVAQIPSHNHDMQYQNLTAVPINMNGSNGLININQAAGNVFTRVTGGSQSHNHAFSGSVSTDIDVQYIDVIIAARN